MFNFINIKPFYRASFIMKKLQYTGKALSNTLSDLREYILQLHQEFKNEKQMRVVFFLLCYLN